MKYTPEQLEVVTRAYARKVLGSDDILREDIVRQRYVEIVRAVLEAFPEPLPRFAHRITELWQERYGEVSWRCSCGHVTKHANIGPVPICPMDPSAPESPEVYAIPDTAVWKGPMPEGTGNVERGAVRLSSDVDREVLGQLLDGVEDTARQLQERRNPSDVARAAEVALGAVRELAAMMLRRS